MVDTHHLVDDEKAVKCTFGNRTRYVILVLATLCLSSILSNILAFNFTIICMTTPPGMLPGAAELESELPMTLTALDANDTATLLNDTMKFRSNNETNTEGAPQAEFNYSSATQSLLFASVAVGAILAALPIPWLLTRLGTRKVFSIVGFLSALSTAAVPTAARMGVPYLIVVRMLQGIGLAACLPIIGSLTAYWASLKQNGLFIALLSSFLQIAPVVTMPVAGELCTHEFGWPAVYYLNAIITIVLFTAFVAFFRNMPMKHPFTSTKETERIERGKVDNRSKKIPYKAIMKTPAVWAIWVSAIGNFFGTQLVLQFTPIYLNKVLHYPVANTGFASALPSFIMFFIKLSAGLTSDKVTCMSENLKVRVYNTLAVGGQGFFFIALAFVPATEMTLGLVILICATSILGFNSGGFFKSTAQVARYHSHFVMSHISLINCICMLLVPIVVDLLAPDNKELEWRNVFLLHAGIMIASNVFFCIFASGKPAAWAVDTWVSPDRKPSGYQIYSLPQSAGLGDVKVY